MFNSPRHNLSAILASLAAIPAASAQCTPRWINGGDQGGPGGIVYAMNTWDPDGTGAKIKELVVGGTFTSVAGNTSIGGIAAWDGTTWSPIGNSKIAARAFTTLPNGNLVAGGDILSPGGTYISRWDGSTWSPLGSGVNNTVNAVTVTPSGDLIVAGMFTTAGGAPASRIARWTPSTSTWSTLGSGLNFTVYAVAALPSGDIVAGGNFTTAGGNSARYIAKWTATTSTWSAMGPTVMNNLVTSLAVLPSGQLIAGGAFTSSGGFPANNIARWDGTNWQQLGPSGLNSSVSAMNLMPDGTLLVGGSFTAAGAVTANRTALWNPSTNTWSAIGTGISGGVFATAAFNNEPIAGGNFQTSVAGDFCPYFAHYGQPVAPTLLAQPANTVGCIYQQTPISISTAGTAPFTYQWQIATAPGSWANLTLDPIALSCGGSAYAAGATSRLAYVEVSPCDGVSNYQVRCIVSNSCGTVTSDPAVLTLENNGMPADPQSSLGCIGGTAHFSTAGTGPGPFLFFWYKGNEEINTNTNPSAATADLTLSNLSFNDDGQYKCLVRGLCTGVWTNPATLTICPADFDCDGSVDFFDYDAFVVCFEGGACPPGKTADFDGDGTVDFFDYDAFVQAFELGC